MKLFPLHPVKSIENESIINPKAYVVPGYQGDRMPENFGNWLTRQALADLIAYLMTME